MRVVFSNYAKLELEDAARFYNLQHAGLGNRFKVEVKNAALRIAKYPTAWSNESGEVRKYLLHKFPYKLLYSIESDHIFIIAVAHQHRKPNYWVERDEL
ncbi:type II toxin-antitoxin system RelE/ParE family toxin [Syntrophomonas wolfei]|jgi:plasmid stabilization system protein ParE|uniref:type II toxin-antitoxin system RelE/ParE family toxin n=1 Tax=Syntrophomonas wolfei TaxID=863 RepID=UPI00077358F7|nr:type II toxin-antitoxin system RelE/ParE family toxin [Syntrophomonas wolfei]